MASLVEVLVVLDVTTQYQLVKFAKKNKSQDIFDDFEHIYFTNISVELNKKQPGGDRAIRPKRDDRINKNGTTENI